MSKYPYEILVRLSATGVVGAHVIFAADVANPLTEVVQTVVGGAEPLAVADGQAGLSLAAVLGTATAAALVENEAVRAELAAVKSQLSAAQAELARLKVTV